MFFCSKASASGRCFLLKLNEFGLTPENEHLLPQISIDPESRIMCLTNHSHTHRRSFFLLRCRQNRKRIEWWGWRGSSARSGGCVLGRLPGREDIGRDARGSLPVGTRGGARGPKGKLMYAPPKDWTLAQRRALKFKCEPNLYTVCTHIIKPLTEARRLSYSETVNPAGLPIEHFVSHWSPGPG